MQGIQSVTLRQRGIMTARDEPLLSMTLDLVSNAPLYLNKRSCCLSSEEAVCRRLFAVSSLEYILNGMLQT